jgi:cobalamin biosynthesis Mg chelatase CobN
MSRTDVVASIRPKQGDSGRLGSGKRSCRWLGGLLTLPAALLLAAMLAGPAPAAEPTSGYGQTTTTPPTTPTTPTTPSSAGKATKPTSTTPTTSSGVAPAKEETTATAAKEVAPATSSSSSSSSAKATTLPFTGLDLRWVLGIGLLLLGAGFSLLWVQRRQRGGGDSSGG